MTEHKTLVSLRLPPKLLQQVDDLAASWPGASRTMVIEHCLRAALDGSGARVDTRPYLESAVAGLGALLDILRAWNGAPSSPEYSRIAQQEAEAMRLVRHFYDHLLGLLINLEDDVL